MTRCTQEHHDAMKANRLRLFLETTHKGEMGDDEERFELRNCKRCGSTLAVAHPDDNDPAGSSIVTLDLLGLVLRDARFIRLEPAEPRATGRYRVVYRVGDEAEGWAVGRLDDVVTVVALALGLIRAPTRKTPVPATRTPTLVPVTR